MANGRIGFSLRDKRKKISTYEVETGAITAVNLAAVLSSVGAGRSAIDALTLDVIASERLTVANTIVSRAVPSDPEAQNGKVWVVEFHDNQAFFDDPINAIPNEGYLRTFTDTIPGADFALLASDPGPNADELDIVAGPGGAYRSWFEGLARSPYGGTVVIDRIYADGRNR